MIFGKINYSKPYEAMHDEMLSFIGSRFDSVQGGLQCDSWIWIQIGDAKVAIDTFTEMTHEVKSTTSGMHVDRVIRVLKEKYSVDVYEEPELEAHED